MYQDPALKWEEQDVVIIISLVPSLLEWRDFDGISEMSVTATCNNSFKSNNTPQNL